MGDVKRQHILNCSFASWYPNFRKLTIDSIILKAPAAFLAYLRVDGLYLPDDGKGIDQMITELDDSDEDQTFTVENSSTIRTNSHITCDCGISESEKSSREAFESSEFKSFQEDIKHAIEELGGDVMPKMNWSSPKDAVWISFSNSLRCQNSHDIFLLFKSSEFITHDIDAPFSMCIDQDTGGNSIDVEYTLILRKWIDINPSGEFRCFAKSGKLIAICQRRQQFYQHIQQDEETIVDSIQNFFDKHVQDKFPDENCVFDIYMPTKENVKLLDFNPFCPVTDGLMFNWAELTGAELFPEYESEGAQNQDVVFRYLESDEGATAGDGLKQYSYPLDFQHLSTGEDPSKLIDLLKLHQRAQHKLSESSDNDSTKS